MNYDDEYGFNSEAFEVFDSTDAHYLVHSLTNKEIDNDAEAKKLNEFHDQKVVQIYTKTRDGYSSVVVADKDNIYLDTTIGTDEMTILMRGVSYCKNMLPYRDRVDIFTKVPLYEIQMSRYIQKMRLPLSINDDRQRNPELEELCEKGLHNIKLIKMKEFNRGGR